MFKKNINSIDKVKARSIKRLKCFLRKTRQAITSNKFNEQQKYIINAFLGKNKTCSENLIASDCQARWKALNYTAKLIVEKFKDNLEINKNVIFGTLIDNSGNTSERVPIADIGGFKAKAYRTLKSIGINAIGVIEVHPLINYPQKGNGGTLMFHCHFIGWKEGPIDIDAIQMAMNGSRAWNCSLGADPVKLQTLECTPPNLTAVAHYMFKPPHSAKNHMPSKLKPGKFVMMDTISGYRPGLALRVVEGLSQIELMDLVFGVLEGKALRQALRSKMVDWHRDRIRGGAAVPASFDIWRFWYELRQSVGSGNYLPYRFVGKGGIVPRTTNVGAFARAKKVSRPKRLGTSFPPRDFRAKLKKRGPKGRRRRPPAQSD